MTSPWATAAPGANGVLLPLPTDQYRRSNEKPSAMAGAVVAGVLRFAAKVAVPEGGTGVGGDGPAALPTGGASLLQARTVNEVVKAQTNKVRLARLKGELVDRPHAIAHVFKLARSERDAWLNWPARISAQMAAKLNIDPHTMHVALEAAVREHLQELGELRPRVD